MPINLGTPHVVVGQPCSACGACCGGTCVKYKACRQACYPCCTESVLLNPNLDFPALTPLAVSLETGKIGAYDPDDSDLNIAVGLSQHHVFTDENGRMTNYRSVISYIPGCGEFTDVIWTSGEFLQSEVAGGDSVIIGALLTQPGFAKALPNGYMRIL